MCYILIKNGHKFDELFPLNYSVLVGIILNEINLRNMCKSDKLFLPNYIVKEELYSMEYSE